MAKSVKNKRANWTRNDEYRFISRLGTQGQHGGMRYGTAADVPVALRVGLLRGYISGTASCRDKIHAAGREYAQTLLAAIA